MNVVAFLAGIFIGAGGFYFWAFLQALKEYR